MSKVKNHDLSLGYCYNLHDLFENLPDKKITFKAPIAIRLGRRNKKDVQQLVFIYCLKLIILDIIHNGVTFQLPVNNKKCFFEMTNSTGEDFKKARRNGAYQDIDYLDSDFTAHHLQYRVEYPKRGIHITKPIYVWQNEKNLITEYTNIGRKY